MQACKKENGRHAHALAIIVMAAFDEYEGEFFENKHPMCPGCANKVKRSFMGEKVVHQEAYKETTTKLSTRVVKFTETFDEKKDRMQRISAIFYMTQNQLYDKLYWTPLTTTTFSGGMRIGQTPPCSILD